MRLAVTGTPGTGKTTACRLLDERSESVGSPEGTEVIHLGDRIESENLYTDVDEDRDSLVADLDAIEASLDGRDELVIDSHLAHHLPVDRVAVLRCGPERLETRLRERGQPSEKARENAESEALDVILAEAVERHGEAAVYEIDTTERSPESVAGELERVVTGEREPRAGAVDFVGYLT